MGPRSEAQLIAEFGLVAEGLDEWVSSCEEAAIEQGAGPREETLEAWSPYHAQALASIERALGRLAEVTP
jgi:hypothetical protein